MEQFKAIIKEAVLKELEVMQFTHAVDCPNCQGDNDNECKVREWYVIYKELVEKDGPAYFRSIGL